MLKYFHFSFSFPFLHSISHHDKSKTQISEWNITLTHTYSDPVFNTPHGYDITTFAHLYLWMFCQPSLHISGQPLWGLSKSLIGFKSGLCLSCSRTLTEPVLWCLGCVYSHCLVGSRIFSPLCFIIWIILGRWWAVPGFLQTWLRLRPRSSILVSSPRVRVVPNSFHLKIMDATALIGTFTKSLYRHVLPFGNHLGNTLWQLFWVNKTSPLSKWRGREP